MSQISFTKVSIVVFEIILYIPNLQLNYLKTSKYANIRVNKLLLRTSKDA